MEAMIHLHNYKSRGLIFFLIITVILMGSIAIANEDIIVLLDQSKSMKEIEPGNPQKGYEPEPSKAKKSRGAIEAINHVIDDFLKEGDYFSLIVFGNKANLLISQQILYKHERELIKSKIKPLIFEDKKTDILASLEEANNLLSALNTPQRRKILVMITDGINEPPPDSPYLTTEQQSTIYKKLKDSIYFNKWNVNLVGLGDHTDIDKIAQQLGLPATKALFIGDKTSDEIKKGLGEIIQRQKASEVKMINGNIKLKILPKLFGGYGKDQTLISLKSSFEEDVQISLNTTQPVSINGNDNDELKIVITPLSLKLGAGQSSQLKISVNFDGKRPEDGRISKNYFFKFAEGSTIFYPHNSSIEVILPSWWDFYGIYAIITIILTIMLLVFAFLAIRRSQVPEIRISVTANDKPLGESMTLKSKETFVIANQYLTGKAVSARGLNCKIAANVRYLRRKKFAVTAGEAKVIVEGKEVDRCIVGMDGFFDLKDKDGKILRSITITNPIKNDPFGDRYGNDPF